MGIIKQCFTQIVMLVTLAMGIWCVYTLIHAVCDIFKIGQKQEKQRRLICYGGFLASAFLAYGCMVWSKHYSVDSFNVMYDMSPFWHMQLGRYTNCGTILWAQFLGLNQVISQQLFMMLWIIVLATTMWVIYYSIMDLSGPMTLTGKLLTAGAVVLSFVNVFTMELMLFPEMAMVLLLGNLALGLSVRSALEENDWKKWVASAVSLSIALGCYQSYIGVYEAFVLAGIYLKFREQPKKRYQQSVIALMVGGGVSLFNVVLVKVLLKAGFIADSGRGASISWEVIQSNIRELILYQLKFWTNADGILPEAGMLLIGIVTLIGLIIIFVKAKGGEERLFLAVMLTAAYGLGYAPHLIESRIDLSPRSNVAIWAVIAVVWILAVIVFFQDSKPIVRKWSNVLVASVIMVQILTMQDMAANEQAMNAIDILEADQIANKIEQYEEETGNTVSKIAITYDQNPTIYQEQSRYRHSQLGVRIMVTDYSNYRLISSRVNRELQKTDMPDEIFQQYFSEKDWNELNVEEQVFCEDDVAYVAVY